MGSPNKPEEKDKRRRRKRNRRRKKRNKRLTISYLLLTRKMPKKLICILETKSPTIEERMKCPQTCTQASRCTTLQEEGLTFNLVDINHKILSYPMLLCYNNY
jgi:hypothetical protein